MNEIIKIDLFGEEFRFKPDDKVDNPDEVAKYLKNHIKQAENMITNKTSGKNQIAILLLAAMNMSKDFNELKAQNTKYKKDINNKLSFLIKKINNGIE